MDSQGTMFAQVKWTDPNALPKARSLVELAYRAWQRYQKRNRPVEKTPPDLKAMLDAFLQQAAKQSRKRKQTFDCKVRPLTREAGATRTAHHFQWSGDGVGHGKIWHCAECGRVVIAQVVGQGKDNVSAVAAQMFGSFRDHGEDGWNTWALYDTAVEIPDTFRIVRHRLMSGNVRLEFERRGGERIVFERWGLANVTLKKFTLAEWFEQTTGTALKRMSHAETEIRGHTGVRAAREARGILERLRAWRDALRTLRPAAHYEAAAWQCPEANRIYIVQLWRNRLSQGLLEEVVARCACH